MAEKTEKVKVKLPAACYVNGKLQPAGTEVEVRAELAEDFTREGETLETLIALGKRKLMEIVAERKVQGVTSDNNVPEIAQKILDAKK